MKICVCGATIEDETEECEVCGLWYEVHKPETEINLLNKSHTRYNVEFKGEHIQLLVEE